MNILKTIKLLPINRGFFNTETITIKINKTCMKYFSFHNIVQEKNIKSSNSTNTDKKPGYWLLLVIPVTAFGLGTWQIQRKFRKEEIIKNLKDISQLEPLDFPENLEDLKNMEYYPVKIKGKFDHSKELFMGPKALTNKKNLHDSLLSMPSSVGYWVITPFKLSDKELTIMVNRGWIPKNQKSPQTRKEGQITDEVELVGVVRHSEKRQPLAMKNIPERGIWLHRDLEKMAEYLGSAPIMVDANASSTVKNGPIGGQITISIPNNHLNYIFTWYGLSAVTFYLWYLKYLKVPV